jgi:peptidoglycan-associated lipoprotein
MKLIKLSAMLVLALAMTFAATGCKKKPVNTTILPNTGIGRVGEGGPGVGPGGTFTSGDGTIPTQPPGFTPLSEVKREQINIIPGKFAAQTVYFALDSHKVRESERMKVETVAAGLTSDPSLYLIIEGHCDERGTEEYNRSLGSQRSSSLREELIKAGIAPNRIVTETYGEDRPAVQGHDESAWSKNRRGVFEAGPLK